MIIKVKIQYYFIQWNKLIYYTFVGRRTAIGISWIFCSIGGIIIVSINNLVTLYIGIFLAGFGVVPAATIGIVYLNEITSNI